MRSLMASLAACALCFAVAQPAMAVTLGLQTGTPVVSAPEALTMFFGDGDNRDPSDPEAQAALLVFGCCRNSPDFDEIDFSLEYFINDPARIHRENGASLNGTRAGAGFFTSGQPLDILAGLAGRLRAVGSTAKTLEFWYDRPTGSLASTVETSFLVEVLLADATGPDAFDWLKGRIIENPDQPDAGAASFTYSPVIGSVAAVPLPAGLWSLSAGLAALVMLGRRRSDG